MKKFYLFYTIATISISWQSMILSMIQPLQLTKSTVAIKAPRSSFFQHLNNLQAEPYTQSPEPLQQNLAGKTVQKTILGKRSRSPSPEAKKTKRPCLELAKKQNRVKVKKHKKKVKLIFYHLAWILCLLTKDKNFTKKFNANTIRKPEILRRCITYAKAKNLILDNIPTGTIVCKNSGGTERLAPLYKNLQEMFGFEKSGETSVLSNTFTTFMDWAEKNHQATPHPADDLYEEIKKKTPFPMAKTKHTYQKMIDLFKQLAILLDLDTNVKKTILHTTEQYITEINNSTFEKTKESVNQPYSEEKNRTIINNKINILASVVQSRAKTLVGKLQNVVTYVEERKKQT